MKVIGIIGGFGPEATAQFYLKLVSACRKINHGTQPHIILRNVSVPSRMEHDALLHGKNINTFIPFLTVAAKELEKSGTDFIVMPCNTLHIHQKRIRSAIAVPFVSIVDATILRLRAMNITRIGILGSRLTNKHNLFRKSAPEITCISVPLGLQTAIDSGLDTFVVKTKSAPLRKALRNACMELKQQRVQDILIACTDFHGLCPTIPGVRIHDTLDILVEATVNML